MDGAQDLAGGRVRTALRLQRTALAIQLAGAIAHHPVLVDKRSRHSIDFVALPELLPGRADVAVALMVIGEVVAREGAVGALRFVEHRNVRLDTALMHQPGEVLGRTIGGVGRQPLRPQTELLLRTIDIRCCAVTSAWRTAVVASTSTMMALFRSIR